MYTFSQLTKHDGAKAKPPNCRQSSIESRHRFVEGWGEKDLLHRRFPGAPVASVVLKCEKLGTTRTLPSTGLPA